MKRVATTKMNQQLGSSASGKNQQKTLASTNGDNHSRRDSTDDGFSNSNKYHFRKADSQLDFKESFGALYKEGILTDLVLCCDGNVLPCHKVVLAASSGYLKKAMTSFADNAQNTVIIMPHDIQYHDLQAIVDFIYSGEVEIERDYVETFLHSAKMLEIKGLSNIKLVYSNDEEDMGEEEEDLHQQEEYMNGEVNNNNQVGDDDFDLRQPASSSNIINKRKATAAINNSLGMVSAQRSKLRQRFSLSSDYSTKANNGSNTSNTNSLINAVDDSQWISYDEDNISHDMNGMPNGENYYESADLETKSKENKHSPSSTYASNSNNNKSSINRVPLNSKLKSEPYSSDTDQTSKMNGIPSDANKFALVPINQKSLPSSQFSHFSKTVSIRKIFFIF